ncbi:MAG: flagellar export chaperone FliS [Candidatus Sulfopaludibacter sp.]|nr:flagellar export chaperone FliS [Candidatus Sulfopaludibacter sp.]
MWQNAHDAYRESRILAADPLELVHVLYQACTESVREARCHLAAGDIAARCQSISRAHRILAELTSALDHERGGDLSKRLARLYDYMQRRLLEANIRQDDAPMGEVLGLLSTLAEAWDAIRHPAQALPEPASPWSQPMPPEPAEVYAAHGWNL